MLRRTAILVLIALVIFGFANLAGAQDKGDGVAFRERVAACRSEDCLLSVSHLYLSLFKASHYLALMEQGPHRKRMELEVARMRGQLHDPLIFSMMEDGRWDAMTEAQRRSWTRKRWGPLPDDFEP